MAVGLAPTGRCAVVADRPRRRGNPAPTGAGASPHQTMTEHDEYEQMRRRLAAMARRLEQQQCRIERIGARFRRKDTLEPAR